MPRVDRYLSPLGRALPNRRGQRYSCFAIATNHLTNLRYGNFISYDVALPFALEGQMSTTSIGDELRDYVIQLLEADGNKVTREIRTGTKRVDIILEQDDDFVSRRIAIECRNKKAKLSQKEVNEVYADHIRLIEGGKVNELWLISRSDYSPEAYGYGIERGNFHLFTLAQFEERINGFRSYCRQIKSIFQEDGLNEYYIDQYMTNGLSAEEQIKHWSESETATPAAILAGYGMGKTSFCRYIVAHLAESYLGNPRGRVPIYVRLSDIAKQQDIEGLIAKSLASRYRIKNYYYGKFLHLNQLGKFVIIFDGFDEMKHALSWAEFQYNFGQIHSLLRGKAKILIAGRPNAFLSDDEHNWALRGERTTGTQVVKIPGAPRYIELSLRPFSESDTKKFLQRYLESRIRRSENRDLLQSEREFIDRRIKDLDKLHVKGELRRPVHSKIFSDLASDPEVELKNYNVYELYSLAATQISEREASKPERYMIDAKERQHVIERIGWWLWEATQGRALSFSPSRVPRHVIGERTMELYNDADEKAIYRDIFSGPFVERKLGENYFFAHRSFLEFFVAKYLSRARKNDLSVGTISSSVNDEILNFMEQGGLLEDLLIHVIKGLDRFAGQIDPKLLWRVVRYAHGIDVSKYQTSTQLLIRYAPIGLANYDGLDVGRLKSMVEQDLQSKVQEVRETSLYHTTDFVRHNVRRTEGWTVALSLLRVCAQAVDWSYWKSTSQRELAEPKLRLSRGDLRSFFFLRHARLAAESSRDGKPVIIVDFDRFFADVLELRPPKITLAGTQANPDGGGSMRIPFDEVFEGTKYASRATAVDVLRSGVATRLGLS